MMRYRVIMQLHQDFSRIHYTVRAYAPGRVTVVTPRADGSTAQRRPPRQEEILTRSVVIMPSTLIRDWPPQHSSEVSATHFEPIAALQPELVLFGSGRRVKFPDPRVLKPLKDRGIGVEVMDTGAACRTYNILVAEGRLVAAALLMIDMD